MVSFGDCPGARALATQLGLREVRKLLKMSLPMPRRAPRRNTCPRTAPRSLPR
ncbi:hypothetical protein FAM14222_002365 [Propionibacterium freudenreichii]|uniref:hypothetical protein n=1 Tax=Propionibacterium freudenreichii TaxID=1744 RepID=UPI002551051C|nr:hypothetical protein [Propionibacterium freudenreichii]MDK9593945.1 hypothetical protein [Propionibacterium freudenreichii]